jgi:SAM-dependent methyltransferase
MLADVETRVDWPPFACPRCGGEVASGAAELTCAACGGHWPLDNGVAGFGQNADYPQDLPGDRLVELVSVAEASGWQTALHDHLRAWDASLYRRAVDEYRAQWRCLIPSHPAARLLDLRCGLGPIAVNLAPSYGLVVAADTRYEPARFTALRAAGRGLDNVRPVTLNPQQRLPFPAGSFEVVVLHEVVEWGQPAALLKEAARVLTPGGCLFLNAANPLNPARLLGARPGKAGPAASPRPLARGRTLPGYRRALASAGLRLQEQWGILPSVAEPFFVVPLRSRGALRYFLDSLFANAGLRRALSQRRLLGAYQVAQAVWKLARPLPLEPLVRLALPGYGLLASKPQRPA